LLPFVVGEEADGEKREALPQDRRIVKRAVDCGAGIGRITSGLLLSIASQVDIVEPIAKFTEKLKDVPGVGKIFNVGLEEWDPASGGEEKYDLIWNQWCLGHLTDEQLVAYLRRCMEAVVPGGKGLVIVKENIAVGGRDVFDKEDSSVTRTDDKFREIFQEVGLKIRKTELQRGFPTHLYPVRMYALVPPS